MKHTRTIALLLAVLLLSTACQTRGNETTGQSTADTVITEVTGTDGTTDGTAEPTEAPTAPSSEATEPSETPTEPDEPDPEPQEPVTIVGTYDSVEEVFAGYEKRYVTYGKGENNYEIICEKMQDELDFGDKKTVALIFSDLNNIGILGELSNISTIVTQVAAFGNVNKVNISASLFQMYDVYGGDVISATDNVLALSCSRNEDPLLFHTNGYVYPKENGNYEGQLFYFTEENGEVKYDLERWDLNAYWGSGLESWLDTIIDANMTGESIMRHSGTVVFQDGQVYLREEETYTLDEWVKTLLRQYSDNNGFEAVGAELLAEYGCDSIDELLNAYQTMSSEEWVEFVYPHLLR